MCEGLQWGGSSMCEGTVGGQGGHGVMGVDLCSGFMGAVMGQRWAQWGIRGMGLEA